MYANADSIPNEINKLRLVLNSFDIKPSIIVITDIKHKHKWNISLSMVSAAEIV